VRQPRQCKGRVREATAEQDIFRLTFGELVVQKGGIGHRKLQRERASAPQTGSAGLHGLQCVVRSKRRVQCDRGEEDVVQKSSRRSGRRQEAIRDLPPLR